MNATSHQQAPTDRAGLFTYRKAAKWLGVSERTVYALVRQGEIGAVRFGRSVRVTERALQDFVNRHEQRCGND